jgi:hypothetical protein
VRLQVLHSHLHAIGAVVSRILDSGERVYGRA